MATKKEIDEHLKKALKEVGEITPIFDEEVSEWVFSSPLYPVEYGGTSRKEVIKNYPKYLREFIKHRLENKLHLLMKKKTTGHGGKRRGAGRPKGTKRAKITKVVRIPKDIADWVQRHPAVIRQLIAKSRH